MKSLKNYGVKPLNTMDLRKIQGGGPIKVITKACITIEVKTCITAEIKSCATIEVKCKSPFSITTDDGNSVGW